MQSHDSDFLLNPETHQTPSRRKEEADAVTGATALIHGRIDAVTPSAVMHLQKTAGNEAVTTAIEEQQASPVKDVVGSGGGSPLDRDTRGFMESRLGADFGDVRIHTDSKASESAKSVQAYAYTVGSDVVFQSGRYDPQSDSGKRMLAHELTHVVQQRSGPVAGTPAPGGIKISNPSDSFERAAERNADQAMSASSAGPVTAGAGPAVQREAEGEDEPTAQGFFVQREQEEEEPTAQGTFVQREQEEEEPTAQGSFVQREQEEEEPEKG